MTANHSPAPGVNRTALTIAVAVALGGAGLLLLYKRRFESEATGGARVSVLMATREIAPGTRITEEHLGVHEIPEAFVEERHIRAADAQAVIGVRAANAVRPDESVLWSDLATGAGVSRKLAGLVRVGMRALSLPIEDGAFGGLLRPGDRVDVMLTIEDASTGEHHTAVVAQNLLVLAVGDDTGGESTADARPRAHAVVVTLATTPTEGQKLALAGSEGKVRLLLRNPEDVRVVEDLPEARSAEILVRPRPAAPRLATEKELATAATAAAQAAAEREADPKRERGARR